MLQKWLTWFYNLDVPMEDHIYESRTTNLEPRKIWDDNIQKNCTGGTKMKNPEGSDIRDVIQKSPTGETALPKKAFWKYMIC